MNAIIFLASFLLSILIMFTGSSFFDFFGFQFKFVFSSLSYFGFTYLTYMLSQRYQKSVTLSLLFLSIPPTLILIFTLIDFNLTLLSLPSNVAYILGISSGVLFIYFKQKIWKLILCIVFSIILICVYISLYSQWIHYVDFRSFSGVINNQEVSIRFHGINENYELVSDSQFTDKVVVLNFWNTGCRYCHKFFPKFKELSLVYSSKDTIFVAFNSPLERDEKTTAINFFDISNSNVSIIIPDETNIFKSLRISGFPSYIVVNKSSEVVFHGSIDMLEKFLQSN